MSDVLDDYSDLELNEADLLLLDAPPEQPLSRNTLVYGSEAYCASYRHSLTLATQRATGITPHPWQLDCALASHLGRDVFVLAGTGFGKTLAFMMSCFLDSTLTVWLISPLNALGNQQAKTFSDWGLRAIAVNATTNYPGLYKARKTAYILAFFIISSIEAFLDTTRLLPAIKSPELAKRGRQMIVIDEAHVLVSWVDGFRPLYSLAGDLKLILTHKTPYVAATATANNLAQKTIKKMLRFGQDSLTINLGNHRSNLAFSVHRLKHAARSVMEILDYFPSRTELSGFTLIFVDSRPLAYVILHILRQYIVPELRSAIDIYHACRGEYDKMLLAASFEREDGIRVMITTEALTLGINFRIVSLVIQFMAPTNLETALQRMGRGGRDGSIICEAVMMVQDSLFEDSKEGLKQAEKAKKGNEPAPTAKPSKKAAKAIEGSNKKPRRSTKEYSDGIRRFINTTGCRVDVLDQEYDNPPRPEGEVCPCDSHRVSRTEETFLERMKRL
ncbi:P-loop containing nucleoside triphosphate hydrolase protein [Ceratobasidium sp. AG-I]|nr:P-loop containing nucleoside triphosphate hydrolase protein [Ceratobasidium sp. AG-I]